MVAEECIELEMNDVGLMFLGGLFTTLIMLIYGCNLKKFVINYFY